MTDISAIGKPSPPQFKAYPVYSQQMTGLDEMGQGGLRQQLFFSSLQSLYESWESILGSLCRCWSAESDSAWWRRRRTDVPLTVRERNHPESTVNNLLHTDHTHSFFFSLSLSLSLTHTHTHPENEVKPFSPCTVHSPMCQTIEQEAYRHQMLSLAILWTELIHTAVLCQGYSVALWGHLVTSPW